MPVAPITEDYKNTDAFKNNPDKAKYADPTGAKNSLRYQEEKEAARAKLEAESVAKLEKEQAEKDAAKVAGPKDGAASPTASTDGAKPTANSASTAGPSTQTAAPVQPAQADPSKPNPNPAGS